MRTLIEGKTEQLECHLTTEEFLDRATALAVVCQDITREDGRQSQIKADMKAQLSRLEAEQSRLTLVVTRKAEPREVRVTTFADDDKAEAMTVRDDTGEVIRRRALDLSERQLTLPVDDSVCAHGFGADVYCPECTADAAGVEPAARRRRKAQ